MQFVNTFSQGGEPDGFALPTRWGAVEDPNYHGPGRQYILNPGHPNAGMQPVFGLTWRESAQYCNWLCNNQSSDPISLTNGAYDTSTFTYNPGGTFNDQLTHNPGSRFWIPTFDEWIKAAHYDPNRNGPGQSGWWQFDTSSDVAPVPGAPGVGQTSAGYILPGDGAMDIPLGSYPSTLSPWGLLDTSGGTSEWTEETFFNVYGQNRWRWADGSVAGRVAGLERDRVGQGALDIPEFMGWDGLRIASAVPSPSAGALWGGSCVAVLMRRTRPR
jgi:formylglycine-generating enzyme required for sulfatase activity